MGLGSVAEGTGAARSLVRVLPVAASVVGPPQLTPRVAPLCSLIWSTWGGEPHALIHAHTHAPFYRRACDLSKSPLPYLLFGGDHNLTYVSL